MSIGDGDGTIPFKSYRGCLGTPGKSMQGANRLSPIEANWPTSPLELNVYLDKLPAAAYLCDAEGYITYYNQRAVELWGRAPKLNDYRRNGLRQEL